MTPNKKHGSKHHANPRSRIPKKLRKIKRPWNIIKKSVKEHRAWHRMFNNRLICEAIDMICKEKIKKQYCLKGQKRETRQKLKALEGAYKIVFGSKDTTIVITKEWTPRHPRAKCFQFKECFEFHNPKKVCPLLRLNKKGELT